eukprot:TRINITY_DN4457_c0_g1_i1.p1 TRINITY_DN4457_c0_g1~~TRINITY_DN4457_c0_g1_i1.p1  ORF type:complete len:1674 (-),score=340.16 TRINITY_DN4457_c0_g1_i1:2371-7392(-)
MPLYRTVSDRGLWKKNQKNEDPKPQHFHKPNYIDKNKPVITYSQLDLGEGYRYNSKQSIPDVRKDVDEANARFDEAYSEGFNSRRNRNFKSCPTTPRATTPTRTLSRSRVFIDRESEHDNCYMNGVRARNSNSQCSQINPYINGNLYGGTGQFYPEDDRYSFESRSLTAYSNYSERDSIIDNNYRYPYAKEPTYKDNYDYMYPDPRTIERENPFQSGKTVNYDAENVVNMFLQKSFFPNVLNNNFIEDNKDIVKVEDSNSTVSPTSTTSNCDPPNATSSPRSRSNSRAAIAELKKSFLAKEPEKPVLQKPKVNKYLRNANQWKTVQPKTITYPKPEQLDNVTIPKSPDESNPMPDNSYGNHLNVNIETPLQGMESHFMCDTVKAEHVPKLHHAEIIHVRKETTSTSECSSTSSEEEDLLDSSRNIMVNINPLPPLTQTKIDRTQVNLSTPKLEAPPQKQNIWGPNPRHNSIQKQVSSDLYPSSEEIVNSSASQAAFTHSASTFQARQETDVDDFSESCSESVANEQHIVAYRENITDIPESNQYLPEDLVLNMSHTEKWKQEEMDQDVRPILPERSFQDPAFANFHESNQTSEKFQQKQKKKGFFSSLFKKPNKRKQPYGDDYIHIERRVENDETSDSDVDRKIQDLHDQSPRFHILKQDNPADDSIAPGLKPVVPMPGSSAHRQLFSNQEISSQQTAFPPIEQNFDANNSGKYSVSDQTNVFQHEQTFQSTKIWSDSAQYVAEESAISEMIHQDAINAFNSSIQQLDEDYSKTDNGVLQVDLQRRPSVGKPTDLDAMMNQQQMQPSLERKLSISKPTNLDDPTNHKSEFHSSFAQSHIAQERESTYIPEHERTQEIDIDALLALPETPEETEEEVEAENFEYKTPDNPDMQLLNQREIAIEQLRLEEEQRYLENQNMVLQQQLVEKENERLRNQNEDLDSILVPNPIENSFNEFDTHNNVVHNQDFSTNSREDNEKIKEQTSSEENTDIDQMGKRKPKSFFNFNSFRKPKQKDKVSNMGRSETETSGPSDTDNTPDDANKEFSQILVEKRRQGISNVFSAQKLKHRHSYHPTMSEEISPEDKKKGEVEENKSESDENSKLKTKRKGVTKIFKTSAGSQKPAESSQLPKQEDQELYPVVTQNSRISSSEDVSDDLATQIVREIQKSTTELNFKSQSMPKLNSNKANNKSAISSVFPAGGLRMSMRKSKKKSIKEEDPVSSSCNEDDVNESNIVNQDSVDIQTNEEGLHDSRPRSHSLHQKREKKSTFGDIFGMRSSSRDRKQAKRPLPGGNVKNTEAQLNDFESPAEAPISNDGDINSARIPKKKETKPQTGLGALFGSNKQKKQRSKSQERNKNKAEAQQFSDAASDEPERGIRGVSDLLAQTPEKKNVKKPESYPSPLFGSTLRTQNTQGIQNRHQRPMDKPPLPPTSAMRDPPMDDASNFNYSNSPSPQSYSNNIKSTAISLENQRMSPNMSDTQEMDVKSEEAHSTSRLSNYSTTHQRPDSVNTLNDSGTPGKMRQTGRQSGRFRKSSTISNISGIQTTSSNLQRQTSFSSQAATNDAQSMFMDSITADPQSRPITPHNPEPRKKPSSVSRTESYRKARGQDDDRPRIIKRNDTYNSLPRSKKQVRQLRAANSEDSLRNAINREENSSPAPREKSRQGRRGKDGECSVM